MKQILLIILFLISGFANAQQWVSIYENQLNTMGQDIKTDSEGNSYVLVGEQVNDSVSKITIIKYNSAGTRLWVRNYDPGSNVISVNGGTLVFENNFIYTALERRKTDLTFDIVLLKYNTDGLQQWERIIDSGPGDDHFSALSSDHSGNILVVGQFINTIFGTLVAKYDPSGNSLWTTLYEGPACSDLASDVNNNVYLTGYELTGGLILITLF